MCNTSRHSSNDGGCSMVVEKNDNGGSSNITSSRDMSATSCERGCPQVVTVHKANTVLDIL